MTVLCEWPEEARSHRGRVFLHTLDVNDSEGTTKTSAIFLTKLDKTEGASRSLMANFWILPYEDIQHDCVYE